MARRLCALVLVFIALGACGCGGSSSGSTPPVKAVVPACVTLTLVFTGCDEERLDECQREYPLLPPALQANVDGFASCLQELPPFASTASWPDTASCSALGSLDSYYFHGACQEEAGRLAAALEAFDPCEGTPVSCATITSEESCSHYHGVCAWSTGACTDLTGLPSCEEAAGACSDVPGCKGEGFPSCGDSGQPACFLSGTLPGVAGL